MYALAAAVAVLVVGDEFELKLILLEFADSSIKLLLELL